MLLAAALIPLAAHAQTTYQPTTNEAYAIRQLNPKVDESFKQGTYSPEFYRPDGFMLLPGTKDVQAVTYNGVWAVGRQSSGGGLYMYKTAATPKVAGSAGVGKTDIATGSVIGVASLWYEYPADQAVAVVAGGKTLSTTAPSGSTLALTANNLNANATTVVGKSDAGIPAYCDVANGTITPSAPVSMGTRTGEATAVNAIGNVIVGTVDTGSGTKHGFVYNRRTTSTVDLPLGISHVHSEFNCVTLDLEGYKIGGGVKLASGGNLQPAVLVSGKLEMVPQLPGSIAGCVYNMSGYGEIVVGTNFVNGQSVGFVHTASRGTQNVVNFLANRGVNVPANVTITSVLAVGTTTSTVTLGGECYEVGKPSQGWVATVTMGPLEFFSDEYLANFWLGFDYFTRTAATTSAQQKLSAVGYYYLGYFSYLYNVRLGEREFGRYKLFESLGLKACNESAAAGGNGEQWPYNYVAEYVRKLNNIPKPSYWQPLPYGE